MPDQLSLFDAEVAEPEPAKRCGCGEPHECPPGWACGAAFAAFGSPWARASDQGEKKK